MKKDSSNIEMKKVFSILSEIKHVEPTENMYAKVLDKIQERKKVSKSWIYAAASAILLLISIEFQWINTQQKTEYFATILKTNNTFYNE